MEAGKDDGSATPLLESDLPFPASRSAKLGRTGFRRHLLGILLAFNICWSLMLLYLTVSYLTRSSSIRPDCKPISVPSPLLQTIDLGLEMRTLNGSIQDDGSIFRQGPSDEVDEAWSRVAFEDYQLINVTEADIIASGKDPTTRVRWDQSVDAYPAQVEFAHQIHCLDMVRKEIWGERYFGNLSIAADDAAIARNDYDPNSRDGYYVDGDRKKLTLKGLRRLHRQHTMHCLHILLQNIMCNVDVGIITHDWIPGNSKMETPLPHPLADFSTKKMCRSFDAAADWVHKNAVTKGSDRFSKLTGSPDVQVAQRNDSYWP